MEKFMRKALELASEYHGFTSPNPAVGAVVVKNDKIIAIGAHQRAGEAHAEAIALEKAGAAAKGATLYVNLEPCNHYGKTPPCTQKIISAKISKVVCAMRDPNPIVAGSGIAALKKAKIEVVENILRKEAKQELARKEEEYRSKISKLKSDVYKKYNKIFDILKNKIDRLEFGEIRILEEYELGKGYYQIDLQIGNSTYTIRLKENERRELRNNYKKYNEEVRKVKNKEKEEKRRFEEYKRETEEILNLIDDAKKRIYKENKQNLYEIINYLNKLLDLNQLRS